MQPDTQQNLSRQESGSPAHQACANCTRLDRREFLNTASILSLGALLAACGDGVIDGPLALLEAVSTPVRVDPALYPALQQLGGRAIVTPAGRAPMLVETIGTKQYRAFSLVCPHKGTVVDPTDDGFLCPNHGARFTRTGTWVGGQPTVDLSPIAVTVDPDGTLLVGGVVLPPAPPALALSTNSIAFSATVNGATPPAQTVDITNSGGGTLAGIGFSLTYGNNQATGWLAVTLATLSAPSSVSLSVARGSLPAGSYTATVTVTATDTSNAAQTIAVTLIVIDTSTPAALQLSSTTASFSGTVGGSVASQAIQIINSGAGAIGSLASTIAYGAGATGWLSTSSFAGSSTPTTFTLRPQIAALQSGTYTATITISGAGVTSKTIAVTLTVVNAGLPVTLSAWPALANVGGAVGSVGVLNFSPVAVVRTGASSFVAFSLVCPHAGSIVQVINNSTFRCPNHGATWFGTGQLMPNSPQATTRLVSLRVTYTPGDTVLYVS